MKTTLIRIGMDISKSVSQLHGVDADEEVVVRRPFRRTEMVRYFEKLPPALIAIESCGSSHHWARLLQSFGHDVKLMPPQYVKPCVKRGKNDAADAEALCEAVTRSGMRFVPVRSREQQAACMLMTVRERLVSVRSQLSNAFCSYAAEFGIVGPAGRQNVNALVKRVLEDDNLPELARDLFRFQAREYAAAEARTATPAAMPVPARINELGFTRRSRRSTRAGRQPSPSSASAISFGLQHPVRCHGLHET